MKHLKESIVPRNTEMYVWDTKESIVEFLRSCGYVEFDGDEDDFYLRREAERTGKPMYKIGKYSTSLLSHWIKFYDPVKNKSEVMFCRDNETLNKMGISATIPHIYASIYHGNWKEFKDFKEFREYIRKYLGI